MSTEGKRVTIHIPFRVWVIGSALVGAILLTMNYPSIEAFVIEFWWLFLVACFVGVLASVYYLGVQHGSPIYTATLQSEAQMEEVSQRWAEVDIEVSTVVNEQASKIMQLEEQLAFLVDCYKALKVKYDHTEFLRKKWYRLYRQNTGIFKALIANPAMHLPRTWRRYQESLLS